MGREKGGEKNNVRRGTERGILIYHFFDRKHGRATLMIAITCISGQVFIW